MLDPRIRRRFDDLLDREVAALPPHVLEVLDELPLVVEDEPSDDILREMGYEHGVADLCGLHEAVPMTERGVDDTGMMPGRMMLFRGPIVRLAGYRVVGGVEVAPGFILSTPDPAGEARMPSPLFYDRGPRFEAYTGLRLIDPVVTGGPVEPVGDAGLRITGMRPDANEIFAIGTIADPFLGPIS